MKILIISTFFPPENSIASFRPYSWAKWWSRAGHNVTVLTTEKNVTSNDLHKDLSGFKIISLTMPNFWRSKKSSQRLEALIENNVTEARLKKKNIVKQIFLWYMNKTGCFNCRFPSLTDFWAAKAKKAVNPFDYDAIISTGGPYSVHFVANFLKKKNPRLIWCVDWRDYWTQSAECHGSVFFRWWEKIKDKQFLNHADFITSVSDQFCDTYRAITRTPVYTVCNGFDPDDFKGIEASERRTEKIIILYAGTIYDKIQDPSPLYRGLVELYDEGKIKPEDVKVLFCGSCAQAVDKAKKIGAEEFVEYLGRLTHEKTISLEKMVDVVLFLGHDAPEARGLLTGKLFEYLYCAKEIWAVGISNRMQAGEFMERANAGICFGTDVEKIKEAVLQKLNVDGSVSKIKDMEFISQFERKKQAEFYLKKFEECFIGK